MYIDIDANDNLPEAAMATFQTIGPAAPIRAVRLHLHGTWHWCAVVGWNAGPGQAWISTMEESGDGIARLVHGDAQGLRLQRIAGPDQVAAVRWDVGAADQWGEPFLICLPEVETA